MKTRESCTNQGLTLREAEQRIDELAEKLHKANIMLAETSDLYGRTVDKLGEYQVAIKSLVREVKRLGDEQSGSVRVLAPSQSEHYCGFCGKSQTEVDRLVEGKHANICGDCVERCRDVIGAQRQLVAEHKYS